MLRGYRFRKALPTCTNGQLRYRNISPTRFPVCSASNGPFEGPFFAIARRLLRGVCCFYFGEVGLSVAESGFASAFEVTLLTWPFPQPSRLFRGT